jgi:hypothetical protein
MQGRRANGTAEGLPRVVTIQRVRSKLALILAPLPHSLWSAADIHCPYV